MSDEAYTIFCRNLAEDVTESILYELFLQAGPVEDVRIPMTDGKNRNYGFIVYKHKCSVKYALDLFRDTRLYGKTIALQNRILDAEREAEMRNRSWRNDEVNSLRGGPPNPSRFSDMNVLRGGPSLNHSRNDDFSSLRGGPIGFSRRDLTPRDFTKDPFSSFSPKSEKDFSPDPRLVNPYSYPMIDYSDLDSKGFPANYGRYDRAKDRYDRSSRESFRNDRDSNRNDRGGSRRDRRDYDNFSRKDRFKDNDKNDLRSRIRRSKSRDRSPIFNKNDKSRPR